MTIETAPPMAHAVGGSLGSALALLLLYPLERARVELQTMTASAGDSTDAGASSLSEDIHKDKVAPLRGGVVTQVPTQKYMSGSEESWESCRHRSSDSGGEITSSDEEVACTAEVYTQQQQATPKAPISRQQKLSLLKCIYQLHLRKQLYKGVAPVVTTMAASNFVFFYMHSFLKQWLAKATPTSSDQQSTRLTLRLSLLASTLAGIANVLLTNPMWVANLRIVTNDTATNLWQEMKSIVQVEGWTHLWNGTPASLLLVSNPVLQFVCYEELKTWLLQATTRQAPSTSAAALKPLEAFLLGAVAKAVATVLTYPLQLAQTVLRVQKQEQQEQTEIDSSTAESQTTTTRPPSVQPSHQQSYRGTLDCLIKIYKRKGLEGCFAGMQTKLLQSVLTSAFTFLSYEQIIRAIMAVHRVLQEGRRVRHGGRAAAPIP